MKTQTKPSRHASHNNDTNVHLGLHSAKKKRRGSSPRSENIPDDAPTQRSHTPMPSNSAPSRSVGVRFRTSLPSAVGFLSAAETRSETLYMDTSGAPFRSDRAPTYPFDLRRSRRTFGTNLDRNADRGAAEPARRSRVRSAAPRDVCGRRGRRGTPSLSRSPTASAGFRAARAILPHPGFLIGGSILHGAVLRSVSGEYGRAEMRGSTMRWTTDRRDVSKMNLEDLWKVSNGRGNEIRFDYFRFL
mmetsp:Transcript_24464/g.55867  ORF Transcript_24464/g.55867 Transcript_24464/m.55867 type:complete len:245 (+) Transcript_24464:1193-1927(+)